MGPSLDEETKKQGSGTPRSSRRALLLTAIQQDEDFVRQVQHRLEGAGYRVLRSLDANGAPEIRAAVMVFSSAAGNWFADDLKSIQEAGVPLFVIALEE